MPRIDDYRFGTITIDGVVYTDDVIILPGRVVSPWWRRAGGHVFAVPDLGPVLDAAPAVVVLGTGYHGRVIVPEETLTALRETGAQVFVAPTTEAVDLYTHHAASGKPVVAALHLTC